jgi:hypothetical protein
LGLKFPPPPDSLRQRAVFRIETDEAKALAARSERLRERCGEVLAMSRRLRVRFAEISRLLSVSPE